MIKIPTIYLCGPIAGCDDAEAHDWREYVKEKSKGQCKTFRTIIDRFITLDPMRRDYRSLNDHDNHKLTYEIAKEIVEFDKIDIEQSDAIIAWLNPKKSSVGTHQEIIYAWEKGKLVVLVTPREMVISPWLLYHSQKIFHNLDDAIRYILEKFAND